MKKIIYIILVVVINVLSLNAQTQSDDSDSLWSIQMPQIQGRNIDFGKVVINTYKDSLIINFLENWGRYDTKIKEIYIKEGDETSFSQVNEVKNFIIFGRKSFNHELRFTPKRVGQLSSKIYIITQADTLTYNLTGEGVYNDITVLNNIIDFGKVQLGKSKDSLNAITIKNVSLKDIDIYDISVIDPNKDNFSILKLVENVQLPADSTLRVDLNFKPTGLGKFMSLLSINHSGVNGNSKIQLFGRGVLNFDFLANSPVCVGDDITLVADSIEGAKYIWFGPDNFKSNERIAIIRNATESNTGKYYLYIKKGVYVSDTLEVDVLVSKYSGFPSDKILSFVGNSKREYKDIKMTNAKRFSGGGIFLNVSVPIKESFESIFSFYTKDGSNEGDNEKSIPGADGFSFIISGDNGFKLGQLGGDMGYTSIENCIAIEYDLYKNEFDPNGNHLAVQNVQGGRNTANHLINNSMIAMNSNIMEMTHNTIYYTKISYDNINKLLTIYLSDEDKFDKEALFVTNFDLNKLLELQRKDYVYIGITAATGSAFQAHYINDWLVPCNAELVSVDDDIQFNLSEDYQVYTTPNYDYCYIKLPNELNSEVRFKIYDINGSPISEFNKQGGIGNSSYKFNISDLSAGIYFIKIEENRKTIFRKFIVIR